MATGPGRHPGSMATLTETIGDAPSASPMGRDSRAAYAPKAMNWSMYVFEAPYLAIVS